ncbi:acyltransferase [Peribacillus frigoritolerans]|uniref:acyltransferase family protein n=1 Tax=Peribacillus frigoritolerans TaxID=450367 RepID=UPI0024C161E0|nr:acyltransferase [Peribacillus frigoritolerans]WHX65544.1 acyltransferase [Peribacillus frigoritolerans]
MKHTQTLKSIQMIRGIAAILVVLYHINNLFLSNFNVHFSYGFFSPGSMGVDVFFVLSGFIMYYIHHSDIGKKSKLKNFARKRFIRIYPVYWVVSFFLILLYLAIPSFGESYYRDPTFIIKSLILIPQSVQPILGVAWSLTHEVYFYLIFALLIIVNKKYYNLIIITWVTLTFLNIFIRTDNYFVNFLLNTYNFEFLLGGLVAFIVIKKIHFSYKFSINLALGLFLISWLSNLFFSIDGYRVILWGIPSALLLYGLVIKDLTLTKSPPKFLLFLGDASYSIYLTHIVGILFSVKVVEYLNLESFTIHFFMPLLFLILIVIGCLFHVLIEKPLLKVLHKSNTKIEKSKIKMIS